MKEAEQYTNPGGGYEKRDSSGGKILAAMIIGLIALVVIIYALSEAFTLEREQLVTEIALSPESKKLYDVRVRENANLQGYAVVDSAAGIVRIPIERAMEIMVERAKREEK